MKSISTSKFRRKVFFKEVRKEVGEVLRTLCEYKNVELVKGSIRADHVHMYVKIPPKVERIRIYPRL
ncbi:hypothetical protein FE783_36360 [Paenibacillus mesophilus]|uniref:transposase n=1 Tax=Paenibacillus mesophilus TaxID=2582849 RepID=UPI00110EF434|nr:hypothetical protein FE783_36360 [Paenibacillus mesophilus]